MVSFGLPKSWEAEAKARFDKHFNTLTSPYVTVPATALTTVLLTLGYLRFSKRRLKRIRNVDHLEPWVIESGKVLKGRVTSVGDGDNFRFYHRPGLYRLRRVPSSKTDLKDETLHIRLAGVDAPEAAHFGKPAQPYSAEALQWLTKYLNGRNVAVRLFSKDRYGRVVGMTYIRRFPWLWRTNVSEEMLKAGLATLYEQDGAQYGGSLERFKQLEATAKQKGRGMWAKPMWGKGAYESPAEYKRRHSGA
ncbi:SNase-domain-containing protein [Atractiella rhizophila]|nr:SNase-domain-containing protein [Atractiella rhizophila]